MKTSKLLTITFVFALCMMCTNVMAQQFIINGAPKDDRTEAMKPTMSEFYYPQVKIVTPGDDATHGMPSDAISLFNGKDLSAWENVRGGGDASWIVNNDGTFTVNKQTGDIRTKEKFGDFQLHLEWRVPANITGSGQARGNSGVIIFENYEVQILDGPENETYVNGQAGAIYKQAAPLVNPIRKAGEWNVYDIIFTAPTFKEDGTYRTHPYITVLFNGVLIQNNTFVIGTTEYIGFPQVKGNSEGSILLQAHGDRSEPISFRNIWIRKL